MTALLVGVVVAGLVLAVGRRLSPTRARPAAARQATAARELPERLRAPLAALLVRAGVSVNAEQAVGGTAAVAGTAVLLAAWAGVSLPIVMLAGVTPIGAAVGELWRRVSRHPQRVAAQLPGVLRHIADATRAGMSLRAALERAENDAPVPIRDEVRRIADDLRDGARAEDALDGFSARIHHTDVDVAVCAVLVTLRAGGDLPRVLMHLSENMEERRRLAAEIAAATGQARMTAWLVLGLPAVGALAVEVFAPGTLGRTLGAGLGQVATAVALLLFGVGALIIRRLARVPA